MAKSLPGGIRPETVRLLADITAKVANGSITHEKLERLAKGENPFGDRSSIDWERVYDLLGMYESYNTAAEVAMAEHGARPNVWTMSMLHGVTCNNVVNAFRKLGVAVHLSTEYLDAAVIVNDRDPNKAGSYVVSFATNVEADEAFKNFSACTLYEHEVKGITLLERLILDLGYFLSTGKHLDRGRTSTLCSGSRCSGGMVPIVFWLVDGGQYLCVKLVKPESQSNEMRARVVVP